MNLQRLKGNFILLFASFIWGLAFIAQSKGVESVPPSLFNGLRTLLGGLVLLPIVLFINFKNKKKGIKTDKKTLLLGGIICGVLLCLASTVQTIGLLYTSPGKAGFITALYMVIIPIIGILRGKVPRFSVLLSVLIAIVGLYLMCIDTAFNINFGDILMLICALLFSFHILAVDYFSPKVEGVYLATIQFFVCGSLNLIYSFIFEDWHLASIFNSYLSIGYAGIFSCGIAYTFQIVGQKYTDPTSASVLMSLESVFATLATVALTYMGWNFTGGKLTFKEIFGCVLMFVAIILVQLPTKIKTNKE